MLKIENNNISIHRKNAESFYFTIPEYEFQVGDIVEFLVFKEKGYDSAPIIHKIIEVNEVTSLVEIELTEEDTDIGVYLNEINKFWYEILLNGNKTVIGFEKDIGAKEFNILPSRGGNNHE